MSYWDFLTEDLQDYIINIRDEELTKDYLKKAIITTMILNLTGYMFVLLKLAEYSLLTSVIQTSNIFWNLNFTFKCKLSNQLTHTYTEQKRIKIRYDSDNVPYYLFEYNSRLRDKLYFKQLRRLEPGKLSYCWKFLSNNIL